MLSTSALFNVNILQVFCLWQNDREESSSRGQLVVFAKETLTRNLMHLPEFCYFSCTGAHNHAAFDRIDGPLLLNLQKNLHKHYSILLLYLSRVSCFFSIQVIMPSKFLQHLPRRNKPFRKRDKVSYIDNFRHSRRLWNDLQFSRQDIT